MKPNEATPVERGGAYAEPVSPARAEGGRGGAALAHLPAGAVHHTRAVPHPDVPDTGPAIVAEFLGQAFRNAELDAREPECPHPAHDCRLDGIWKAADPATAALTCTRCGTSIAIPLREDLAVLMEHGGPRADGPESSEVMSRTMRKEADHA